MAKPDDRSNNEDRIQNAIENTMQNINEAKDFIKAHENEMNPEDVQDIQNKNERREQAIRGFREEIKDESNDVKVE